MINTLFAKKLTMTSRFTSSGDQVGSTILSILPMKVLDHRETEKHGYKAIRLRIKDGNLSKIREVRTDEVLNKGDDLKIEEILKEGDLVAVSGKTKGRGFAGAVKRHGFRGGPRTHGQSDRERAPGSSGSTTTPGRVYKGKRRAGRYGGENVSISNLRVLSIDPAANQIVVAGSVPGANKFTLLKVRKI